MAVHLFFATLRLGITGSVGYLLLKLLAAASGGRLSQGWRYRSIVGVSLLFVLPVHKLWALIPISRRLSLPVVSAGTLSPQPMTGAGIEWGRVIEWAAVLWLCVAVGLILWNAWRLLRYRRLIGRSGSEVSGRLCRLAVEEARLAGIYDEVRLLVSPLAQSPMLVGFFHPAILLPSEQLPDSDARFIFSHELTHFKRKDLWKKLLVLMVRCIHWFNPVAYLLNRDFACWLETSCDEYVVRSLGHDQRKEYGRLLINYASATRYAGPKLYVSFTSCRYKLKRRISTMLNSNKKSRSLLGVALAVALMVSCLATSAFAAKFGADNTTSSNSKEPTSATNSVFAVSADGEAQPVESDLLNNGPQPISGESGLGKLMSVNRGDEDKFTPEEWSDILKDVEAGKILFFETREEEAAHFASTK